MITREKGALTAFLDSTPPSVLLAILVSFTALMVASAWALWKAPIPLSKRLENVAIGIANKQRWPRRWLHSPPPYTLCEQDRVEAQIRINTEAHEKASETIRRTILVLSAFALFCVATTFATPDVALLGQGSPIKIPYADTPLSFLGFLVTAPLVLFALTIYLHIFVGYARSLQSIAWSDAGVVKQETIQRLPTVFNIETPLSRLSASFLFYWLVPVTLALLTWKAAGRPEWGFALFLFTTAVTAGLLLAQIRRCSSSWRLARNAPRYILLVVLGGISLYVVQADDTLRRPLSLARVNLENTVLTGINVPEADFTGANLRGVNLERANLSGATFEDASLDGAELRRASLVNANLNSSSFNGADLSNVNLTNATAQGAILRGANLSGAVMNGVLFGKETIVKPPPTELIEGEFPRLMPPMGDCNFHPQKVDGADLREADLRGAVLTGGSIADADLRDARLEGAKLVDVSARRAQLDRAILQAVDATNADFRCTTGITSEQIQSVCKNGAKPHLPDELDMPIIECIELYRQRAMEPIRNTR
jgi:uncharacterized protein YjbI with pentapeptide repeats